MYVWKLRWIFHKCGVHGTLSLPSGYNQELFCYNAFSLLLILRVVQTIILYGTSFFGQEGDSNTVLFWLPHGMQLQSVWTLKNDYHQLHMCSLFAVPGEDLVCEYSRLSAFRTLAAASSWSVERRLYLQARRRLGWHFSRVLVKIKEVSLHCRISNSKETTLVKQTCLWPLKRQERMVQRPLNNLFIKNCIPVQFAHVCSW